MPRKTMGKTPSNDGTCIFRCLRAQRLMGAWTSLAQAQHWSGAINLEAESLRKPEEREPSPTLRPAMAAQALFAQVSRTPASRA